MPRSESDVGAAAVLAAIEGLRQEIRALRLATVRFLDCEHAAEYLGVTPQALRQRVFRGTIPAWCYSHMGRSLRFNRVAIDEWQGADERSQRLARRAPE